VRERIAWLAAALWWGSLSALGGLYVPLLFKHLGSPAAAGAMAAKLFAAQTWLSAGCAMVLLLAFNRAEGLQALARAVLKYVVAGLLLALLVDLAVAPRIVSARATGGSLALWHGLGSALFLGQWLCATLVLWRLAPRP
jgi:hypothetical protein